MKKIFRFLYTKRGKQKQPLFKEDPSVVLEKAYNKLGLFFINNDTQLEARTFEAKVICEMAVKNELLIKISDNIYQSNIKDERDTN